jgi:cytochrome c-type biogenesis protein CcsB
MMIGSLLIGIFLLNIFKPTWELKKLRNILAVLLFILFVFHTFGLGLRWYIAGHEPWSNGYESMIYIAWATLLAGFIFQRQSASTLGVTALLSGITLLTAHMSWMNPEITNLVPVLKSYWLTIHVATITASYGFLGLAAMMGFLNLCIMIFRTEKNIIRVNLAIRETSYIIELSMMIGLILLVIGNFLGGVWANESWGRYWGWDPKETWSLVTIIVYSFILHLRLIPGMKTLFSTNFGAMVGLGSVLMTYFGVNYYLSGLHSYAQGDPVPVPIGLYYTVAFLFVISILAAWNQTRLSKYIPQGVDPDDEDEEN